MKIIKKINLKASKGKETIAKAKDVFAGWIDSDFVNRGADKKGKDAPPAELAVCELTEDMAFAQMFPDPEKCALTQGQIVEFCRSHQDKLCRDWYTFFLFKSGSEFFVACVNFGDGGRLRAKVRRLSYDYVWDAECRRRFVIPQPALDSPASEPLNPGHSGALPDELIINNIIYLKA